MVRDGPIMRPLASPKEYPAYRAWSIDVGAFTTDFAALTLDPKGETIVDLETALTTTQHSVPLGIGNLDERVLAILPSEQREWLQTRAQALDWEDFRNRVYTQGRPLLTAEVGAIGGSDQRKHIEEILRGFAQELREACLTFCSGLPPVTLQELLLTGGGNFIPAIHETLTAAMQSDGRSFVHVFIPAVGRRVGADRARRLDVNLARGGSALGGASVYFEKRL
jgi:hypothetical protein